MKLPVAYSLSVMYMYVGIVIYTNKLKIDQFPSCLLQWSFLHFTQMFGLSIPITILHTSIESVQPPNTELKITGILLAQKAIDYFDLGSLKLILLIYTHYANLLMRVIAKG